MKLAEVQEACGIIQDAADDDANIIFGAVMDEKMKDAVKITVIATGFKECPNRVRRPKPEFQAGFVISREEERAEAEEDDFFKRDDDRDRKNEPPPLVMLESESVVQFASAEPVISLDAMRTAMIGNFEPEDLDVPAFMRKRSETM